MAAPPLLPAVAVTALVGRAPLQLLLLLLPQFVWSPACAAALAAAALLLLAPESGPVVHARLRAYFVDLKQSVVKSPEPGASRRKRPPQAVHALRLFWGVMEGLGPRERHRVHQLIAGRSGGH